MREESSYRHRVDDVRPCTRTERPSDMSRDGLRIESVVASPENGENCGWLPKIFFNGPRHRKTTRLAVVCSLRHALNCLGLESRLAFILGRSKIVIANPDAMCEALNPAPRSY